MSKRTGEFGYSGNQTRDNKRMFKEADRFWRVSGDILRSSCIDRIIFKGKLIDLYGQLETQQWRYEKRLTYQYMPYAILLC